MAKLNGFFTLHRRLFDDPLWLNGTPVQKVLMILCIGKANHESKQWAWQGEKFEVKRGQFITSLESLKTELGKGATTQKIRTALNNLEKYQFLTNKSTKTGRLIEVLNYCKYQDVKNKVTKQTTKTQQRPNKDLTPNNNDNNVTSNKYSSNSTEFQLANHLFEKIRENNPEHKKPNLQSWAVHISRMINIDKRNPEKIKQVIDWCQADDFWYANILSTKKLRAKYDQLLLKMNKEPKPQPIGKKYERVT